MHNRYRGEIPFPQAGEGAFVHFSLADLAELEDLFGRNFFGEIEEAAFHASPRDLPKCLGIGLKSRDAEGKVTRIWDDLDHAALKFTMADVGEPILDAISQSHLGKTYKELVEEAEEARKKAEAERIKELKEAAEKADLPFDKALLEGLSKLLTAPE